MSVSVLFVTWELAPFFHIGGLGDVSRSLPRALSDLGVDVRIVLPFYSVLKFHNAKRRKIGILKVRYDGEESAVQVYETKLPEKNVLVYLFQNARYLDEPMSDTYPFFNTALIEFVKAGLTSFKPQIVHCNDWHTGLFPILAKHKNLPVKILFTIHNLSHQGKITIDVIKKTGINLKKCRVIQWELKKGQINSILEGIIHADLVNTVSPTYAKEILTEEYGAGLDDVLRNEKRKISGILNGIDYNVRKLSNDKFIKYHYCDEPVSNDKPGVFGFIEGKRKNKKYLQKKLNFEVNSQIPLISFVGRFSAKQKGVEIIHKMLRRLPLDKYQFVFLGKGDEEWEERYLWFNRFYPKNVFCEFKFDEKLASQIYAASDFLLIPSLFEPCGLIQMLAMKYGTLPVAHDVGGLHDSIDDGKNGFLFKKYASHDLETSLKRAISVWKNDKTRLVKMIQNAMEKDFSWELSAKKYIDLYNLLLR